MFDRSLCIEKTLKEGERGHIYLVRDTHGGHRYIQRVFSGSTEVYQKIKSAAPPHVPKIEAIAERDGQTFVLEEYIQGDTLASLLRDRPLSEECAKQIVLQLCDTLGTLHGLGIVHRDIKPENVIMRGDEAVLIDFDVSRLSKPERRSDTQLMGTAGYAAPEQYGFSQTDGRADIFALGIMLNEMLTKQHPSKCLTESAFRPIVEKCIEVNIDKRFSTAAELRNAIENIPGHGAGSKRKPLSIVLPIVLFAVLGMIFAIMLFRNNRFENEPMKDNTEGAPVVQSTVQQWPESANPGLVEFAYDLDGDEKDETYFFGAAFLMDLTSEGGASEVLISIHRDSFGIRNNGRQTRLVFPCVWSRSDDGRFEVEEAFIELLENPETVLWRIGDTMPEPPVVSALNDSWNGGIKVEYDRHHGGEWLYEVSADIGGETMKATSISICNVE